MVLNSTPEPAASVAVTATPNASLGSTAAPAATGSGGWRGLLKWLVPGVIALTAVCAMTENRVDTDLWGHVVYGREVLRDGKLPQTTTWSYVTQDQTWINHENIAELLLAWTADTFGVVGLSIGKLLLALTIVASWMYVARRDNVGWVAIAIVTMIAGETMRFHWHFRPQALSYVCFTLMIGLLTLVFRGWSASLRKPDGVAAEPGGDERTVAQLSMRWLWLLPVLFVVWVNSHGGFAAGVAVVVAFLGLRSLEALRTWGRAGWKYVGKFAAVATACVAATVVNPYGIGLHLWLAYDVGNERPEIADWQPLDMFNDPVAIGLWMLLGIAAISLPFSRRKLDLTQLVVMSLVLWQSISHCRHLCFFAILAGYWLVPHLDDMLRRVVADFKARSHEQSSPRSLAFAPRTAALLLIVWGIAISATLYPRVRTIPVRRDWYPVTAMQYVSDHGLTGKFLVDFNWAQYAIMCFAEDPRAAAESRVAVDGRLRTCYPWSTLDVYLDFYLGNGGPDKRNRSAESPPFQADRALEIGPPDLVLVWRDHKHSVETMEAAQERWVLLYQDSLSQLWGRKDRYDVATSPDYIPLVDRIVSDAPQEGSVDWPAIPVSRPSPTAGLAAN
ncbi:MAG: hypothetical protein R3B90_09345 [Planctomycetaceae bacterium]